MAVTYEWKVEVKDGDDITDVRHWSTYADAKADAPTDEPFDICLVRNYHHPVDDDLIDRCHAYVREGALSATFDEGGTVPARFLKEAARP